MNTVILLIEDINPTPWMAPDLSVGRAKGGRTYPQAHSPAAMRAYQDAIKESVAAAYPNHEPFPKGTPLYALFYFWRKLDSYKTPKGRNQTAKRADATNCTKSTEDALQGLLYVNDVDNRMSMGLMVEHGPDVEPKLMVVATTEFDPTYTTGLWARTAVLNMVGIVVPPTPPGNVRLEVIV